jgi:hypothetical protein
MNGGRALPPLCERGPTHGRVRRDVEPAETAGFLMAMVEGYVSLAKNAQDAKVSKTGRKTWWAGCGPCACRATASRADRIVSEECFDTIAYQPVRMLGSNPAIRLQATSMRESERKD